MRKNAAYLLLSVLSLCYPGVYGQITPPAGVGNNIVLWLNADTAVYKPNQQVAVPGNRVGEWHDISGNGYVFTPSTPFNRPTYTLSGTHKMIAYTGGDVLENVAAAAVVNGMTEFSVFAVIQSNITNTDKGFLCTENPNGADELLCMRYDKRGANTGRRNLIKCGMQGNTPNNQIESKSNTQTTGRQVLTLTWKQGGKINLYINGVLNESSVNTISSPMSGIQKILVGQGPKDTGWRGGWDGNIGTIIFYNSQFPADTIGNIAADLNTIVSAQSGAWNNPLTWDCACVPGAGDNVKILNGHTVTLQSSSSVGNVIVEAGGTLDGNGNSLDVTRNLLVEGTFIHNMGTVNCVGTEAQYIGGTGVADFYNITISNSAGVNMNGAAKTLHGTLDIQNGCFDTGNILTLLSDATGTARIAAINGTACLTGDITMQRYINAGQTNWRFFSSPVSGVTLEGWDDNFITSGIPGTDFPTWPSPSSPWPSFYYYDETVAGARNNGFTAPASTSRSIGIGEGYWVWCGDTITGTNPFTIDQAGTPITGTHSLPVSYTNTGSPDDGWNMVGNPYPSTIDWDDPNWTKTNLDNAIYIWDPDAQVFAAYVFGIGTNGGSRYIPSSQAFWVKANAASPALTIREGVKSAVDQPYFKKTPSNSAILVSVQDSVTNFSDEIAVRWMKGTTSGFENAYDAFKMESSNKKVPSIKSLAPNGDEMAVNSLWFDSTKVIPVKVTVNKTGTFTFNFTAQNAAANLGCAFFIDKHTGATIDLKKVLSYKTTLYDTTKIARFYLKLGAPAEVNVKDATCDNIADGDIEYKPVHTTGTWDFIWTNINGDTLQHTLKAPSDKITGLKPGQYQVEVLGTDFCGNHSDVITVGDSIGLKAGFILSSDTVEVTRNMAPMNTTSGATAFNWDFNDGTTSTQQNPVHAYNNTGNYEITLIARNGQCLDTTKQQITVIQGTVGLQDIKTKDGSFIYPNPATDELFIRLEETSSATATIFSLLGDKVGNYRLVQGNNRIPLNGLPAGKYIISITGNEDDFTQVFKLVVAK